MPQAARQKPGCTQRAAPGDEAAGSAAALGPALGPWEVPRGARDGSWAGSRAGSREGRGVPSPALLMQHRLAERVVEDEAADRWPWRVTVAFVLVTCSAFWTTLYALLRVLVG